MQLVIDIPEEAYNRLLEEQHLPNRIDLEYFIVHGTPLEKVFENIKAEIRKLEWYGDDAFWDGVNAVSDIIDKHIGQRSRVNEFCE